VYTGWSVSKLYAVYAKKTVTMVYVTLQKSVIVLIAVACKFTLNFCDIRCELHQIRSHNGICWVDSNRVMKITGYPGPDRGCRVTGSDPGIRSEHYYLHGWFGGRDGSILSVSSTISAIPILSVSYRRVLVLVFWYISLSYRWWMKHQTFLIILRISSLWNKWKSYEQKMRQKLRPRKTRTCDR